jgi:hypothetical protein
MYVLYYASILQCCQLVWILVRADHPCLGVGCHIQLPACQGRCVHDRRPWRDLLPPSKVECDEAAPTPGIGVCSPASVIERSETVPAPGTGYTTFSP